MKIKKLAKDKEDHMFMGMYISIAVLILAIIVSTYITLPFWGLYGIIAASAAGIAKEVYDKVTGKGTPEVLDFVWTAVGGTIIYPIIYKQKVK